jgi:tRNA modification GTPase
MTGNDTIAAISTASGEGGIGIVRISGELAADILGSLFVPARERSGFSDKTMYYGHIVDPSSTETVDEVLAVFMKGPRSYTGEDVCEIQCHGGGVPLRRILELVCSLGAVPAQPGEFTKRAFLNGRLDLIQAGAVIDLIRSKTALGYHAAKEQAEGRLSERVRAIRELLLIALAEIAVRIDYPEEFEPAVRLGSRGKAAERFLRDKQGVSNGSEQELWRLQESPETRDLCARSAILDPKLESGVQKHRTIEH